VPADRTHELLTLTADVVIAHVTGNDVPAADVPALIASIHEGLARAGNRAPQPEPQAPAVPIRSSVRPDYLVCLEDGRRMTMLRRHLMTRYGLTPDAYRAKWNLPPDYPMVAPNYAAKRRAIAHSSGFGKGRRDAAAAPEPVTTEAEQTGVEQTGRAPAPAPATPAPAKRKLLKPLFATDRAPKDEGAPAAPPADGRAQPLDILRVAIAHRLCVTATYNKRHVLLAPHIVFTRHDEPYLRGVTIELDGKRPREAKLGTFKLIGLGSLTLTGRSFEPFAAFHAGDADYVGTTLAVLS